MTSRLVTLVGFAAIGAAAVGLELAARLSRRVCTFGDAFAAVARHRALRVLLLAAWLWLGWHVFVRMAWR